MSEKAKREIHISGGVYSEDNKGFIVGGDFVAGNQYNSGLSAVEVKQLFAPIYSRIETKSDLSQQIKEDLKIDIKDVEQEAVKGENADENFLARRLRNIGRMAPDIFDIVIATLTNPSAGFAMVVKKVAEKANTSYN